MDTSGLEFLHGPSSSAERSDHRISRKQKASKDFWQQRVLHSVKRASDIELKTSIFDQVVVYLQGYIENSSSILSLKRMVMENGGSVSQYLSLTKVTHVICRNLSGSNTDFFARHRSIKVVSPEWIVQSCSQQSRLPESDFLVLKKSSSLDSFLTLKKEKENIDPLTLTSFSMLEKEKKSSTKSNISTRKNYLCPSTIEIAHNKEKRKASLHLFPEAQSLSSSTKRQKS